MSKLDFSEEELEASDTVTENVDDDILFDNLPFNKAREKIYPSEEEFDRIKKRFLIFFPEKSSALHEITKAEKFFSTTTSYALDVSKEGGMVDLDSTRTGLSKVQWKEKAYDSQGRNPSKAFFSAINLNLITISEENRLKLDGKDVNEWPKGKLESEVFKPLRGRNAWKDSHLCKILEKRLEKRKKDQINQGKYRVLKSEVFKAFQTVVSGNQANSINKIRDILDKDNVDRIEIERTEKEDDNDDDRENLKKIEQNEVELEKFMNEMEDEVVTKPETIFDHKGPRGPEVVGIGDVTRRLRIASKERGMWQDLLNAEKKYVTQQYIYDFPTQIGRGWPINPSTIKLIATNLICFHFLDTSTVANWLHMINQVCAVNTGQYMTRSGKAECLSIVHGYCNLREKDNKFAVDPLTEGEWNLVEEEFLDECKSGSVDQADRYLAMMWMMIVFIQRPVSICAIRLKDLKVKWIPKPSNFGITNWKEGYFEMECGFVRLKAFNWTTFKIIESEDPYIDKVLNYMIRRNLCLNTSLDDIKKRGLLIEEERLNHPLFPRSFSFEDRARHIGRDAFSWFVNDRLIKMGFVKYIRLYSVKKYGITRKFVEIYKRKENVVLASQRNHIFTKYGWLFIVDKDQSDGDVYVQPFVWELDSKPRESALAYIEAKFTKSVCERKQFEDQHEVFVHPVEDLFYLFFDWGKLKKSSKKFKDRKMLWQIISICGKNWISRGKKENNRYKFPELSAEFKKNYKNSLISAIVQSKKYSKKLLAENVFSKESSTRTKCNLLKNWIKVQTKQVLLTSELGRDAPLMKKIFGSNWKLMNYKYALIDRDFSFLDPKEQSANEFVSIPDRVTVEQYLKVSTASVTVAFFKEVEEFQANQKARYDLRKENKKIKKNGKVEEKGVDKDSVKEARMLAFLSKDDVSIIIRCFGDDWYRKKTKIGSFENLRETIRKRAGAKFLGADTKRRKKLVKENEWNAKTENKKCVGVMVEDDFWEKHATLDEKNKVARILKGDWRIFFGSFNEFFEVFRLGLMLSY